MGTEDSERPDADEPEEGCRPIQVRMAGLIELIAYALKCDTGKERKGGPDGDS